MGQSSNQRPLAFDAAPNVPDDQIDQFVRECAAVIVHRDQTAYLVIALSGFDLRIVLVT